MALDALAAFISQTTVTGTTSAQSLVGSAFSIPVGTPNDGYDLTVLISPQWANLASSGSTAAVYGVTVQTAADTSFSTSLFQQVWESMTVSFVNASTTTSSVYGTGGRAVHGLQSKGLYARVIVTVPATGSTAVTSVVEALLGQSIPA